MSAVIIMTYINLKGDKHNSREMTFHAGVVTKLFIYGHDYEINGHKNIS